jgi:hypothetical protein
MPTDMDTQNQAIERMEVRRYCTDPHVRLGLLAHVAWRLRADTFASWGQKLPAAWRRRRDPAIHNQGPSRLLGHAVSISGRRWEVQIGRTN